MEAVSTKIGALSAYLARPPKLAVAFSGGVDSSYLLAVAHAVLGDAVVALTAQSPAFPAREHNEAVAFCTQRGIRQIVFDAKQFEIEGFAQNPPERCYLCKRALFETMAALCIQENLGPLADGSNVDDLADYRPGYAALKELKVISPLVECGFTKADIRMASDALGLPSAHKPSFACLATRFPYGHHINPEALARVDIAEQALLDLGFSTVRVRVHHEQARIEVPTSEMGMLLNEREIIVEKLKSLGFTYVAADLQGYRSGSMNETL